MKAAERHKNLKSYNTFGLEVKAELFLPFDSEAELKEIFAHPELSVLPYLILGGGSNMLLTQDLKGLVLYNQIKGLEITREDDTHVWLRAGAGEVWHELVLHTIEKGWGGLENLSLIPGTVGAAPIQNIGAYGVELKDVFEELNAFKIADQTTHTFNKEACAFGYRSSIFKTQHKGQYIITSVTFKLSKQPKLNISYGAIQDTLKAKGVTTPTVKAVSDAVIAIRQSKLPDPAVLGNAGSFFKNPEIALSQFEKLKALYPDIVSYPAGEGNIKVPAGWLIERCGWKGKVVGKTGVHKDQALVLVNYGGAQGNDIQWLSEEVQKSVFEKFGITLEAEVNII